jgi:hypothetical protein
LDRRVVIAAGAGAALLAVIGLTVFFIASEPEPPAVPPGGHGLVVEMGRDDDIKLDERRPLRCFVGGQLVGEIPLKECARRNGVDAHALGVGLDPTGALAAADDGAAAKLTPLPADEGAQGAQSDAPPDLAGPPGALAGCWRYAGGAWSRSPADMPLGACLRSLYAGVCEPRFAPIYGRWGERTLRLVDGRIEISPDNADFQVLADRAPGCRAAPDG